METKPLPKVSLGQRIFGIIVCFGLFNIVIGFVESFFKSQSGFEVPPIVPSVATPIINFILLLASMAIIKSKTQFETGDWKKVAMYLVGIDFVLSIIGVFGTIASFSFLYHAYPVATSPFGNQTSSVILVGLISFIEMVVVIFLSSWLVLRKSNAETVSQIPPASI